MFLKTIFLFAKISLETRCKDEELTTRQFRFQISCFCRAFLFLEGGMYMFIIQNCSAYKQDGSILFENVSFTINSNDKLAVIGEEGNGKSTLMKYICGLDTGPVDIHAEKFVRQEKIGYLSQQLDSIWNTATVLEYLLKNKPEEEIEISKYNDCIYLEQLWTKMKGSVSFLYSDQLIGTCSGGEKVRLQLLKLMAEKCTMLCLDEPTNDLDIDTLIWLEDMISGFDGPILFISHDEMLLRKCANRVLHLELRNKKSKSVVTLYEGYYDDYRKERFEGLRRQEQIAASEKRAYRKKMDRLNDIYNAVHHAQNAVSRQAPQTAANLKKKMHTVLSLKERFEKEELTKTDTVEEAIDLRLENSWLPSSKIILDIQNMTVSAGEKLLIENVSLLLRGQDHLVLTGKNGSGKSCLMKKINELLQNRDDLNVGYMPQNYFDLMDPNETPLQFLDIPMVENNLQTSRDLLASLNFKAEEMQHVIQKLSDGQKAKIFFAKFVKMKCNVLLLDEPTRNLSPMSQPVIHDLINSFEGCVFCVSHDRWLIEKCFSNRIQVQNKRLIKL